MVVARVEVVAVVVVSREVLGEDIGVSVLLSVVKINLGSSNVLWVVLAFFLRAFTIMPPSTFTVTVFDVVLVMVVVIVVVIVVVVVVVVVEVIVVNFVIDFFVVVTGPRVVPEVLDESFLLRGLAGGVMRIEGRALGFSELFPS